MMMLPDTCRGKFAARALAGVAVVMVLLSWNAPSLYAQRAGAGPLTHAVAGIGQASSSADGRTQTGSLTRGHAAGPGSRDRSRATALTVQSAADPQTPPSAFDRIWSFAEWYEDDSNPIVQRVSFSGRYQHDFTAIRADEGDLEESNVRRMRLGPKVTLFRTFTVHAEVEMNPQEHDPLYMRLTDAYVQWARSDRLALTVGKHGVPFTLDGSTSSKDLLTIDRSNLANNLWFPQEYIPGISVSGRVSPWSYRAGVYSAGEATRELGRFSGGLFTLGVLGYDFGRALGVKEALVSGSYVYVDPDRDNTFTRRLEQVASVTLKLETVRWGVRGDASVAEGDSSQPDLWGVMAMPFVNLTDRLQFVARYTVVESDGPNGVQLATYENRVVPGLGDLYREGYLGGSYFFHGHKLKVQSGVQFADLDDRAGGEDVYSGWSWTTGIRVGW